MSPFPAEICSKIVEEVNFDPECLETFKEDIRIFNVLNSIKALKPIISKHMSIWIIYTDETHFNPLKYSLTFKDLRKCTDSFFIITTDHPTGTELITTRYYDEVPLIFDIHNLLDLEAPQSGLRLGIDQESLLEKLVLLSEKRPKRIIELTLPGAHHERDLIGFEPYLSESLRKVYHQDLWRFDQVTLTPFRRITRTFINFNKEFDVLIDHKTTHLFPILEYDYQYFDYDYNIGTRCRAGEITLVRSVASLFTVPMKFWGPTPILNELDIDKLRVSAVTGEYNDRKRDDMVKLFDGFRRGLWTDYEKQVFYSEYFRINRASYYYMIETLSSKKWE